MPWMLLLGIHRADVHLEPPHHYNVSVLEGSADRVFPPSCRMRRGQRSEWARRRRIQTTGIVKMKSNFDETTDGMVGEFVITSLDQFLRLWSQTYNAEGKPDWSHILPYYNEDIHFIDSVQELRGFRDFKDMVERLARRSGELKMRIVHASMEGNIIFFEWEMTILFRKTRTSVIHGASRLTLNEKGKIIAQRDYYDLWGDIFDNIPVFSRLYRKFMQKIFG